MVDLVTYTYKDLNTEKITPEELFTMLMLKKYMSQNMYVLLQSYYV